MQEQHIRKTVGVGILTKTPECLYKLFEELGSTGSIWTASDISPILGRGVNLPAEHKSSKRQLRNKRGIYKE